MPSTGVQMSAPDTSERPRHTTTSHNSVDCVNDPRACGERSLYNAGLARWSDERE
jgi:hypothetical protein